MASTLITPPDAKNLIRNPIYVTFETSLMSGGAPPYTPDEINLACRCEVWRETPGGDEMLGDALGSPYSTEDKRTTFDIANLIPRVVSLPTAAAIGVSPGTPYSAEATGLTNVIKLKHADQYGSPVVAEALTTSDNYLCIDGGLPADALQDINWAGALVGLHSYYYKRNSAFPFRKPVAKHQPDFIYFVAFVTDDVEVTVTVHYDDGTQSFYVSHTIAVEANKAYWTQSGYDQLKVDDNATPGKTVIGYDVSLVRVTGSQNAYQSFYVLDDMCPSWERFILYHNSFGGYETVRMKGITRYRHRVTRDSFHRTRWTDFDVSTGTMDDLRVYGSPVFNTHTGHYPAFYLEHLRQMLHGKLWLIDTDPLEALRYRRIISQTDEIEFRTDIPGADGFALTYRFAWDDDGFNIY